MSTGNSSGETRRCDAKCYNAKGTACHCCCGGRNHGVGREKALENIRYDLAEMVKDWLKEHPEDRFRIDEVVKQFELSFIDA